MAPDNENQPVFVLDARRMITVAFALVVTSGLVCGVSYVAGRASAATQAREAPPSSAPLRIAPAPVAEPRQQHCAAPRTVEISEVENGLYFQLTSNPPGVAKALALGLLETGIDAKVTPGASPAVARVLVGPVEREAIAETRTRLEAMGFQPFLRRVKREQAAGEGLNIAADSR